MVNRYPFLSVIVLSIAFLLKIDFVVMNYHTAFHRFVFVLSYFIFPFYSLSITPLILSTFLHFVLSFYISFLFSISSVISFSTSRHSSLSFFSLFPFLYFTITITVLSISIYSFELFPINTSCLQSRVRSYL
jgi:hypothetical protein